MPLSVDHDQPLRRARDERRLRRADDLRHPVPDARRRGAHRQGRRQLRRQPHRGGPGRGTSDLDLVVAGTEEAILMVEAGANEIPEAEILDALDIAHGEIKKLVRAAARAGREGRQGEDGGRGAAGRRGPARADQGLPRRRRSTPPPGRGQARAPGRDQGGRGGSPRAVRAATPRPTTANAERRAAVQLAFDKLEKEIIRERIAVSKKRPDGRAADEIRADLDRGRRRSAHARLGAVHARPDPGPQRRRARHHARGDAPRHPRARDLEALLPPLQLPAASRSGRPGFMRGPKRRDIGHGALAERALVPMIPSHRGVPVHDPRRLGHPRVQRLVLDGLRLRLHAVADGRRRADQGARWPASRWA